MPKKRSPAGGEIPRPRRNTKRHPKNIVSKRITGRQEGDLCVDFLNGLHLASLFVWGTIFLTFGAILEVSVGLHLANREWLGAEMQPDSPRMQSSAQSEPEEQRYNQFRVTSDGSLIPTASPDPLKVDIPTGVCGGARNTGRRKNVMEIDQ